MVAWDDLLKRVTKRTTTIIIEEDITEDDDARVNEVAKEVVKNELSDLDTRVAMLEQQLELLRRE